jgi:Ala-tRNA(Pro) deacylase
MSRTDDPRATAAAAVHDLLDRAGVDHRIVDHAPTYCARDEAAATGVPPARLAKTIVTVERGTVRLAVVPSTRRLDVDRLRAAVGGSRRLRVASEAELAEAFPDFEVGATPPLGRLIGVEEVIDPLVAHEPEVLAAAGDHEHAFAADGERLAEAAGARVADICAHEDDGRRHRFRDAPL